MTDKERAWELLSDLSIEEKIAQISCLCPFGEEADDIRALSERMPAGIGEIGTLECRKCKTLDEAVAWLMDLQKAAMEKSPHHIPAILHMEGICGSLIQDGISFPSGMARGSSWDCELEARIGETVAKQEAACGITHIFAPVLDVARDPRMGRYSESYSEDPVLAAKLGIAMIKGVQNTDTGGLKPESVAKHFAGFHTSEGGIHGAESNVNERNLLEIFCKPFSAAIKEADLKGVMSCYDIINGESASASHYLLTELLRDRMGFDGVAVSDYGGISNTHETQHMYEDKLDTARHCLLAGMDCELPNQNYYGSELMEAAEGDPTLMELIDRAALRVLTAKFRMGLIDNPYALPVEEVRKIFNDRKAREISLQSARESIVLLKNNKVLPLAKYKKIALIGPHADAPMKYFGGYTHMSMMESTLAVANSIAGVNGTQASCRNVPVVPGTKVQLDEGPEYDEILNLQKPGCRSLYRELSDRLPDTELATARGYYVAGRCTDLFEDAISVCRDADIIILTLGGKYGTCSMSTMGEGVDGTHIGLPECQEDFIIRAKAFGKPVIGVHFDGRPISSDIADDCLDAIIEAWAPGEFAAQAVCDVLTGNINPSGKLPVTVAVNSGQLPVYYNHKWNSQWHQSGSIGFTDYVDMSHRPRYEFGFGLSYTDFTYSELKLSRTRLMSDDCLDFSFMIENTGNFDGTEIAEIYAEDVYASQARPVKELVGFIRVSLKKGEKKLVKGKLSMKCLAFADREMKWKIEKGEYRLTVGKSSETIVLQDSFIIDKDEWIEDGERRYYAELECMQL